ncbi:trypsin alpha-like [Daphnia pulex]|uniref:trypsin alpha-like n=1 Tax=Daphnia pulex TaxID=6669 RepID=UPI001EDC9FAB|nr:trypsin alpha-like [Daphnia pulex]
MESKKLVFVLYATVLSYVAGLYTSNDRIINGGLASPGQFPYVASITENGRHFCGGFIYSSRWVVTAASCIEGKSLNVLNVVVGQLSTINPDVNEQTMNVYTLNIFPGYNSTNKLNDIALIRLTADIQFDEANVDFIVYKEANGLTFGLVMGWGATFEGGLESVNLRYGAVSPYPVVDASSKCGDFLSTEFNFTSTICAGATAATAYPGGSPCQYDEGSPFVQDFVDPDTSKVIPTAVGIFSKNKMCAYGTLEAISVYTRLSVFYPWFLATAGEQPVRSKKDTKGTAR